MPNVTSVWDFSPGETLTAAKLDDVNCGIHVFSGTATRDAAYGGSGERALSEGEFAYLADTNTTQYYDGAAWQTVGGGLTLISTTTIGSAVASVTVSNCFSATYDNYKIIVNGGAGSGDANIGLTLGASATGYYSGGAIWQYPNTQTSAGDNNATSWTRAATMTTNAISADITLLQPFAAARTSFNCWVMWNTTTTNNYGGLQAGFHNVSTSYTDFTLTPASGTMTGGTIRVYGYRNS
jgi:hypothetical protein